MALGMRAEESGEPSGISPFTEQPQWAELSHPGHRLAEATHSALGRPAGGELRVRFGYLWDPAAGEENLALLSPTTWLLFPPGGECWTGC